MSTLIILLIGIVIGFFLGLYSGNKGVRDWVGKQTSKGASSARSIKSDSKPGRLDDAVERRENLTTEKRKKLAIEEDLDIFPDD